MLTALYIGLLIWQILWLISGIRRRQGWMRLLILEIVSITLAFCLMWYYDTLPGYGIMPGWAYFTQVFHSLIAGVVYTVVTLISLLFALLRRKK